MPVWTFYDYVEPSGRVPFGNWLATLPDEVQAHIDARLLVMRGLMTWSEKWISSYRSTGKLYELRIPFNKVQYRPLGMYASGRAFILLAGATERDGKLPAETVRMAVDRQKLLWKEPHHVRQHRYYSD